VCNTQQIFLIYTKTKSMWKTVNDITCWNNLDINEFQPKSNNDMMQCVIRNKSSLFTLRLRACEKQKKTNNLVKWIFKKKVLKMRNMNSFLHEIEMWTTLQWCTLNWIEIKLMILNWKQMRYKLRKKIFKIILWIWCWK
jgi:hypothetical protein